MIYYKIYLSSNDNKLVVVCLQDFDEPDYNQNQFYKEDDYDKIFQTEEEAIKFLNNKFKAEYIRDEFLTPNNPSFLWKEMEHK